MEAHVMKLENNCVIVDEEYFNEIKKQSEFNQERINEIAEEKFLKYIAQNYNTDVYSVSAPTQSIAQKWLRETKNLHIEIYRSAVGYGYAIVKADNGTWQEDDDSRGTNDGGLWDTYEEALEAGIIKALSLL